MCRLFASLEMFRIRRSVTLCQKRRRFRPITVHSRGSGRRYTRYRTSSNVLSAETDAGGGRFVGLLRRSRNNRIFSMRVEFSITDMRKKTRIRCTTGQLDPKDPFTKEAVLWFPPPSMFARARAVVEKRLSYHDLQMRTLMLCHSESTLTIST